MKKPTIFCDIDETLVYSRARLPESIVFTDARGRESYTVARPSAYEFLGKLSEHYELHALTTGLTWFNSQVLAECGFDVFFNGFYGWEDDYRTRFTSFEVPEKWLLVDNLGPRDRDIEIKQIRLCPGRPFAVHEHVKCVDFYGEEFPEQSLVDLIPEIHEKMRMK